ncbi:MAG: DUF3047 domain-containing protein [Victivallaceae bacterium]|nr:DUF3047 domain-containing protein [Victivallaceae bacterium]
MSSERSLAIMLALITAAISSFGGETVWRNDFSAENELREHWKADGSRFMVPRPKFYVEPSREAKYGGRVLVVESFKGSGIMLSAPSPVDLSKTPVMRWRWRLVRPIKIPPGTAEPDDQAVVIYFGDGTLLRQRSVGYRWEVDSQIGSHGLRKYAAGMMTVKHICVENRQSPLNSWIVESRDVVADYKAAFGDHPKPYFIVSVGANSQYTQSDTRAEIDYIEFVSREAAGLDKK